MNTLEKYFFITALAGIVYLGTAQVSFGQLVQNGDFTSFTTTPPGDGGGLGDQAVLSNWTNPSSYYNFVFTNGNAGDKTVQGTAGGLSLWGPNSGSDNGLTLPANYTGNVVAADGAYEVGPLSQVITGLTSGTSYTLTFDWAGAQQSGFNGPTTDKWTVALGAAGLSNATILAIGQSTPTIGVVTKGFSGWMSQTLSFTATGTSETLYFLATGTPNGEPPFSLLANVNMTAAPEPVATSLLAFGMLVLFGKWAWHRSKSAR